MSRQMLPDVITVRSGLGGWRLTAIRYRRSWAPPGLGADDRFTLHDLSVTRRQSEAILFRRGRGRELEWQRSLRADGGWLLTLAVTPDEAHAIMNGADPVIVLAPPLFARPLTLEELMA